VRSLWLLLLDFRSNPFFLPKAVVVVPLGEDPFLAFFVVWLFVEQADRFCEGIGSFNDVAVFATDNNDDDDIGMQDDDFDPFPFLDDELLLLPPRCCWLLPLLNMGTGGP